MCFIFTLNAFFLKFLLLDCAFRYLHERIRAERVSGHESEERLCSSLKILNGGQSVAEVDGRPDKENVGRKKL